ncbi:NADH-quinone oxidoreductase subunit J [Dokdonella fugitiva]|uniref:NADH-quinone oxidoreductase subunit J n=1 Tax=Dokdonella fugitiva TaxID=328517 RepID=A0A839F3P8_9GAMM|nr:NADH-quinone oxidoreductase subunit J [Dokdonella fugitiva]MBA8886924.1 NADH-quinone oxidoreductase subunit J [Dokdonella fugitiva]
MSFQLICFYAFAAITVGAALAVISVRSPVHAALCLVLTFFSTACTWLLADAEFLAIALVLVYVGAVMVLFLFVVMMLDLDLDPLREGFVRALPVGIVVAVVMLVEMLGLIGVRSMQLPAPPEPAAAAGMSNTSWLANALFSQFLLPFEVAALILTVAIVAAIPLTLRRRTGTRTQNPGRQVMVQARDRVRIVKMAAEKPAPAADKTGETTP